MYAPIDNNQYDTILCYIIICVCAWYAYLCKTIMHHTSTFQILTRTSCIFFLSLTGSGTLSDQGHQGGQCVFSVEISPDTTGQRTTPHRGRKLCTLWHHTALPAQSYANWKEWSREKRLIENVLHWEPLIFWGFYIGILDTNS